MESSADSLALPKLKGNYNFRMGIPSCVLPADILPNVEMFASHVDNIELTLFESPDKAGLPSQQTVERLVELAEEHGLTYMVHLPIDRTLGAESSAEREMARQHIISIMRLLNRLKPYGWILHLEGISPTADSAQIKAWQERIAGLLPPVAAEAGVPKLICVENLMYPFEWCLPLIESFGLGVCIDVGHLLAAGEDVGRHLERFLPLARVIHLHGFKDGKDHQTLDSIPENLLRRWLDNMADFRGVLTLEMFNLPHISASIKYLHKCLRNEEMATRLRRGPPCASRPL